MTAEATPGLDTPALRLGRFLTRVGAGSAAGIAIASALAWASERWSLTTLSSDDVPMAPSTAALLVILALSLLFRSYAPGCRASLWAIWGAVATTVSLAAVVVAATSSGFSVPFEEWLAPAPPTVSGIPVGRMSPLTALAFLCAAGGLGLGSASGRIQKRVGHAMSVVAFLVGVTVALGYAAGVPPLYGGSMVPMAFTTASAFAFLGLALIVVAEPGTWWLALVAGAPVLSGHKTNRRLDIVVAAGTLALLFIICLGGIVVVRSQLGHGREAARGALETVADFKVAEITAWRRERLADAAFFSGAAFVRHDLGALRETSPGADASIRDWLTRLRGGRRYDLVAVFDERGRPLLAVPKLEPRLEPRLAQLISETLLTRTTTMTDIYREPTGELFIDIAFPIIDAAAGRARPNGAGLLRIRPERVFLPLVQAWPTASRTAEALLVRREGNSDVFLSAPRYAKGTAMSFAVPMRADVIVPRALRGESQAAEGVDYRGVRVLAASRHVAETPWFLIVKVDLKEVYAPIRQTVWTITLGIVGLAALVVLGIAALWQGRQAGLLSDLIAQDRQRHELAERVSYLMKSANDIILLLDGESHIIDANDRAVESYGYTMEELLGLGLTDLRSSDSLRHLEDDVSRVDTFGRAVYQVVHQRRDGTRFTAEASVRVIEIGGARHHLAVVRDITERIRSEVEIRTLNERLRRLIDAVQELSAARDMARIVEILRSSSRGLTAADGATVVLREGEQCHYVDEDAIAPLWKGRRFPIDACISGWVMLHGEPVAIEDVFADPRIPADAYRPTFVRSLAMVPIRTANPLGAIGNYWASRHSATTMELRLLQTLADAAARSVENVHLYKDLERRVEERTAQLEGANRELEAFSYSVSHDLRAPLRAIEGFSRVLAEDHSTSLDAEGLRLLGVVRKNTQRMAQLIDDLLAFSRAGRQELRKERVDMASLALDVFSDLAGAARRDGIEFSAGALPEAYGDVSLLRQVFVNLISNAIKFSAREACPQIRVEGRVEAGRAVYTVEDNGVGFDATYADKLFGVFQRLHSSREFEGTGVGLALVQRIVARHGGCVGAEGRVGEGARFWFDLPGGTSGDI